MLGWYVGDGAYGDGAFFHFDYYNSFVIHPMLVDVLAVLRRSDSRFEPVYAVELRRARRYAEVEERLIAPDGTFPSLLERALLSALDLMSWPTSINSSLLMKKRKKWSIPISSYKK